MVHFLVRELKSSFWYTMKFGYLFKNYLNSGPECIWFIDPFENNENSGIPLPKKDMNAHTQTCSFRNSLLPSTYHGLYIILFWKLLIDHFQFKAIYMVKFSKLLKCVIIHFFLSIQTTLLYCPSSIDLQTLAEWNSSPISHQFDVISPSHIWIFAHVTQGQDPWIISLSSFLKQENLPKHCSTAVSYAWMFAYTRLQLLSPQVDIK